MAKNPDISLQRVEAIKSYCGFLVTALRLRQIVTCALGWVPLFARAKGRWLRMRCWSDLLAYHEIFLLGIYDRVFQQMVVRTYCDLGCQSGFAILRLSELTNRPQYAMLIDGNPHAIDRCRKNLKEAQLEGACLIHGAVGSRERGQGDVPFIVRPNELECALATNRSVESGATVVTVPAISLEAAWLQNIGDVPCDLLKIDVEGAEIGVLKQDVDFLCRVRACVLEWHHPATSRADVTIALLNQGFRECVVVCQANGSGVLFCQK